jgi:hypothetical protein
MHRRAERPLGTCLGFSGDALFTMLASLADHSPDCTCYMYLEATSSLWQATEVAREVMARHVWRREWDSNSVEMSGFSA